MRKRYTKEEIDLISDLAKQGIPCEEIGRRIGVSDSSIRHILSRRNIKFCRKPYKEVFGEVWVNCLDFQDVQVSNMGRFRRASSNSLITGWATDQGYVAIDFSGIGKFLTHRLVAKVFIDNPLNKPEVNHINGIKDDNRVENLEWVTPSENVQHAFDTGLAIPKNGFDHHRSALTYDQARVCSEMRSEGMTLDAIGEVFGSTRHTISKYIKIYRRSVECPETIETTS